MHIRLWSTGEIVTSSKFGKISEIHYNALGFETYSETLGWQGQFLKSSTKYDPATLKVKQQIKPHYDVEVNTYTDYEYDDPFQRVSAKKVFDWYVRLTTEYAYDNANGIVTITAPDGTQSSSKTNALGEIISRTDEGGVITYTYNALSKPIRIETNGSVTTIVYDAATGNLTERSDLKNGRNETFAYDNLDRLTHAYLNGVLQHEMSYLPNGNIDEKSDVGIYRYDANNKPNAMRGIDGTTGVGISNEKQFITYTAFNKISSVAQGINKSNITHRYNIEYGLDQQRIKSQYYDNGKLRLTRYYFGSYEKDIDEFGNITETDYIYTPAGLMAIVRNAGEFFYIHTDRQGSLERITNANGNIVSEYTYTAWGSRILLSGTNITDRGYTGHEHLTALGLINMNGRVYDPVLARFLSPDPYSTGA